MHLNPFPCDDDYSLSDELDALDRTFGPMAREHERRADMWRRAHAAMLERMTADRSAHPVRLDD